MRSRSWPSRLSTAVLFLTSLLAGPALAQAGPSRGRRPDPDFILDIARYAGDWFQIRDTVEDNAALFAAREKVEQRCVGTRVTYKPQQDGTVRLRNVCFEGGFDGRRVTIEGTARPVNPARTEFEIRFDPLYLRPFAFDYWVIWVDPDYRIALLASPTSRGYTVLSRVAVPDAALLAKVEEIAAQKGYSRSLTIETPQPSEASAR